QTGMFLPGYGGGDIVPAMLEPGELVVPKHLAPALRPFLGGKIPGFQAGGAVGSLSQVNAQIALAWNTLDALYAKENSASGAALAALKSQVSQFWQNTLDPLYASKDALTGGKTSGASSSSA